MLISIPVLKKLTSVCSNQIKSIQIYANNKEISLNEDIKKALYITGNADQIKRLIANLLKNAIDYNRKNGEILLSL